MSDQLNKSTGEDEHNLGISVIIPVYNASSRIRKCLDSIVSQTYPRHLVEIIVVDDGSTDDSVIIAQGYGAIVLRSGAHDPEQSKYIGLKAALHPLAFFIDDDNQLTTSDWLTRAVSALQANPRAVGVQSVKFQYRQDDPIANRYCSLFGASDPVVYYLRRRDHLMYTESDWSLAGHVTSRDADWIAVTFTQDNLPTVGSQGYLAKKQLLLLDETPPYFFHIDVHFNLIKQGYSEIVFLKSAIGHDHVTSVESLLAKRHRDFRRRLRVRSPERLAKRSYVVAISLREYVRLAVIMGTVVIPLCDAWNGYRRLADPAWFLHPYICLRILLLYGVELLKSRFASRHETCHEKRDHLIE